jgi:hypothetical protein
VRIGLQQGSLVHYSLFATFESLRTPRGCNIKMTLDV